MTAAELKDLYDRKRRAMARRPALGRASSQASVRMPASGPCDVEQGGRVLCVDLPVEEGGTGTGAYPGDLMRASVAACLALGYRIWGALLDVPFDAVEINVACEYDVRGQLGVSDDVAPGWQHLYMEVRITSAAPEADLRRLVETAERLSPMLANLSPAIRRTTKLTILRPTANAAAAAAAL
jgi:uncharacterized OsmC-like protein